MTNNQKCTCCGKKIGQLAKTKLKLMRKAMSISPQAKKEFDEMKGQCPSCIALVFQTRFPEATAQLKQQLGDKFEQLPEKVKKILTKGETKNA